MQGQATTYVILPEEEWHYLKNSLKEILENLNANRLLQKPATSIPINYITALEFMAAVRIKRTKFDQLVKESRIKTIKKKRKIYVPTGEIERYFNNPAI